MFSARTSTQVRNGSPALRTFYEVVVSPNGDARNSFEFLSIVVLDYYLNVRSWKLLLVTLLGRSSATKSHAVSTLTSGES